MDPNILCRRTIAENTKDLSSSTFSTGAAISNQQSAIRDRFTAYIDAPFTGLFCSVASGIILNNNKSRGRMMLRTAWLFFKPCLDYGISVQYDNNMMYIVSECNFSSFQVDSPFQHSTKNLANWTCRRRHHHHHHRHAKP
jgi:hypothetical protein